MTQPDPFLTTAPDPGLALALDPAVQLTYHVRGALLFVDCDTGDFYWLERRTADPTLAGRWQRWTGTRDQCASRYLKVRFGTGEDRRALAVELRRAAYRRTTVDSPAPRLRSGVYRRVQNWLRRVRPEWPVNQWRLQKMCLALLNHAGGTALLDIVESTAEVTLLHLPTAVACRHLVATMTGEAHLLKHKQSQQLKSRKVPCIVFRLRLTGDGKHTVYSLPQALAQATLLLLAAIAVERRPYKFSEDSPLRQLRDLLQQHCGWLTQGVAIQ